MRRKVLGIVGSYRKGHVVDQAVTEVLAAAAAQGAETEKVYLLDQSLGFCTNCRRCTQQPGAGPVACAVHHDDMAGLVARIEAADAMVLGAPVNFGNVNALSQRFFERLAGYAFWPWGEPGPKMRRQGLPPKPAVLVTSSAMPALLGRFFTGALRGLRLAAAAVGARPAATLYLGLAARREDQRLSERARRRARRTGRRLLG